MASIDFQWPYAGLLIILMIPLWLMGGKSSSVAFLHSNLVSVVERISGHAVFKAHKRKIPFWFFICWSLLTLGLMRPQWVGKPIEIARSARSIMLTLDTSESMQVKDLEIKGKPLDRLSVAKTVLFDFIDKRKGDRLGLVVFGAESFLHAPLSFDREMIKRFLSESQIGFAGSKTAIGNAIGLSVKKLLDQKEGDRVMILLTDGQNNAGQLSPIQAAQMAQKYHVKIYIIGLGASQVMVDSFFGPRAVNPSRDLEQAEPELKKIAEMTGGMYFRAKDSETLMRIYEKIDASEPVKVDNLFSIPKKELFYWPIALMLFVMSVSVALSHVSIARRNYAKL
ncbi:MAG: VWA domain-containing protein [Myxococcales bacterium]|nr:VWA domain-containing protein [Myxococcales bacterium]USN51198.1 MAG: VWA domain-containing protein [Myxococcales bacterium]